MNIFKTAGSKLKDLFFETEKWKIIEEPKLTYKDGKLVEDGVSYHVYENMTYNECRIVGCLTCFKWNEKTTGSCGDPNPFATAEEAENWIRSYEYNRQVIRECLNKRKTVKYLP